LARWVIVTVMTVAVVWLWPACPVRAESADTPTTSPAVAAPTAPEEPKFKITKFVFEYDQQPHPGLPDLAALANLEVPLGKTPTGYVGPRAGVPSVTLRLGDVPGGSMQSFYASALLQINRGAVRWFNRGHKLIGIYVAPHPADIVEEAETTVEQGPDGKPRYVERITLTDVRGRERTALRVVVSVGVVGELRTIASGKRVPPEDRINSPMHRRIAENSPVRPTPAGEEGERHDLLRKDLLDNYVMWLSRHPGRRIDVAVAPAGKRAGQINLDYLVAENKPYLTYFQLSNTGTADTGRWRERFGFVHNQVTGKDDILSVDYITTCFDDTHSLIGSYEAPVPGLRRTRWRVSGAWDTFTASDVGQADLDYTGESWSAAADLTVNVFQRRELFVDLLAGTKWRNIKVNNVTADMRGEAGFLLPHVALRVERETDIAATRALLDFEWTVSGCHSEDATELEKLGRVAPDDGWQVLRWDLSQSFFLEPLLNRAAWERPDSPWATLAHEVALAFRGQWAMDNRLIPQAEQTVGGLYTVRGYPESAVAGDTTLIANAEYRFHIPNAFNPMARKDDGSPRGAAVPARVLGQRFQMIPRVPYGQADWDLIARVFFDVGRTMNSNRQTFEENETLMGTGVGMELKIKQNISVRVDWGIALRHGDAGEVEPGDNRVHLVATLLY